jgi:small subunit ribosomal protein S18
MAREQRGERSSFRRYFPPKRKFCRFCQRNVKEIDYNFSASNYRYMCVSPTEAVDSDKEGSHTCASSLYRRFKITLESEVK